MIVWRLVGLLLAASATCLLVAAWSVDRDDVHWPTRPQARYWKHLTETSLELLARLSDTAPALDPNSPSSHLSRILIPRVSGTKNNTVVRQYLIDYFTKSPLQWHLEEDKFRDSTPIGEKEFVNLVFTKDPEAPRRLVLAAHYDSKYFPGQDFVGATDSAAPCAILMDVAAAIDKLERRRWAGDGSSRQGNTSLQIIFFDGEEAFERWTAKDSIYGARHLAERWAKTFITPDRHRIRDLSPRRYISPSSPVSVLSTIDHLVLLDLLGAPDPHIHNYYQATGWLFDELVGAEARLEKAALLEPPKLAREGNDEALVQEPERRTHRSFFEARKSSDYYVSASIEDDHLPFVRRGVPILHLIPFPFPTVWHMLSDDASALDFKTMHAWALILRVFVAEYLGLDPNGKSSERDDGAPIGRDGGDLYSRCNVEREEDRPLALL